MKPTNEVGLFTVRLVTVVGMVALALPVQATILSNDMRYSSDHLYMGDTSLTDPHAGGNGYTGDYGNHVASNTTYFSDHLVWNGTGYVSWGYGPVWYHYTPSLALGSDPSGFTPNIGITYQGTLRTYTAFGWSAVDTSTSFLGPFDITFTPDPGAAVEILGFNAYPYHQTSHTTSWKILKAADTNIVLASGSLSYSGASPSANLPVGFATTSSYYDFPVTLHIVDSDYSNFAFRDINFVQAVPEPSVTAFFAMAAALAGYWRRK